MTKKELEKQLRQLQFSYEVMEKQHIANWNRSHDLTQILYKIWDVLEMQENTGMADDTSLMLLKYIESTKFYEL